MLLRRYGNGQPHLVPTLRGFFFRRTLPNLLEAPDHAQSHLPTTHCTSPCVSLHWLTYLATTLYNVGTKNNVGQPSPAGPCAMCCWTRGWQPPEGAQRCTTYGSIRTLVNLSEKRFAQPNRVTLSHLAQGGGLATCVCGPFGSIFVQVIFL